MVEKSRTIGKTIMGPESAEIHLENLDQHANEIDSVVRLRLQDGLKVSAVDYIRAQNSRRIYTEQMSRATESVDVLLSATTAVAATRIGEKEVKIDKSSWSPSLLLPDKTRPFNLSGVPAISVPCGFTSDGLPIGLQLSGKAFEEATVLRVAYAFEQISGLTKLRPPL
jgi:aspartyl-tRNA(Asn)/glutamyl-tRNA(Gln) amidotransferase subunit A